jgi:hypothetical protein
MDIMMPSVVEQPAPAPWLVQRECIDVSRLVSDILRQNFDATVEEIAGELRKRNAELPGDVVADLMQRAQVSMQR